MTKNGLEIQVISVKLTDFQADIVLLLGQLIEKRKKKQNLRIFKNFFLPTRIAHIWFFPKQKPTLRKNKRVQFFPIHKLN
jgi:hypothetical protein